MSVESKNPYATTSNVDQGKYSQIQKGELATLGQRFLGALVDGVIMVPIALGIVPK